MAENLIKMTTEDLMKFTKAELVKMLKDKKKIDRSKLLPIQPEIPFVDMGHMEHGRWRFRYLTYSIENDDNKHSNLYIDSLRRNRIREMKIFNDWFIMLKESNFKESELWQKWYDKFVKLIKSETEAIPKIPSVKLNTTGK